MPRGSIETLRTGFRARVYAGKDPITGQQSYLRGETRRDRRDAEAEAERLLANVEADRRPDQHAMSPCQPDERAGQRVYGVA